MSNAWHSTADYAAGKAVFMPDDSSLALNDGLAWSGLWGSSSLDHDAGLMLTIRVVHPGEPGLMDWESDGLGSGTTIGPTGVPIPEPATISLLALGGLALVKRRK